MSSVVKAGFGVVADKFDGDAGLLRTLAQKGVGVVKVASSLWRNGDAAALGELVRVADELGIKLNAEGVESDEELRAIGDVGFRYAQGFGLARPMRLEGYLDICTK